VNRDFLIVQLLLRLSDSTIFWISLRVSGQPDPSNRGRWITLGYAWARKNGDDGYTIKLNSVPVGQWDGALILLPPFEDDTSDAREPES
jgi:hypothetical protein